MQKNDIITMGWKGASLPADVPLPLFLVVMDISPCIRTHIFVYRAYTSPQAPGMRGVLLTRHPQQK